MRIEPENSTAAETGKAGNSRVTTLVASLMILFGAAEVVTSFTHNFFGLTISRTANATYAGAAIGFCYLLGGLLILSNRKVAAGLAIFLLIADVMGRIGLALTGLYPVDSFLQAFAITIGTCIAAFFAICIGSNWNSFR